METQPETGKLVAVIGQGQPNKSLEEVSFEVGHLLAVAGVSIITGGLAGVMAAACDGFRSHPEREGVSIGVLPGSNPTDANPSVDVAIATGLGEARNSIIATAASVLISVGKGYGTLSEIGFALKLGKRVVGIQSWDISGVIIATSPEEAVRIALQA